MCFLPPADAAGVAGKVGTTAAAGAAGGLFGPLMLVTTGLSVIGNLVQGNQAAAMAKAQKAAYDQQAEATRQAANYEAIREFEKGQKIQSAAITQIGSSGVLTTGSPTEALVENAKQNQLDIEAIRFNALMKSNQLQTQGDIALFGGQQKQQAGYLGAATSVASGLANYYAPTRAVRVGGGSSLFS